MEVFLDPVGDFACYFEIEVNPAQYGARSGRCAGIAADTSKILRGNAKDCAPPSLTGPKFWGAELSIPFASVTSEPPIAGARWRANFLRIDRPRGSERELSAWSPTKAAKLPHPERFGFIEFVGGDPPSA